MNSRNGAHVSLENSSFAYPTNLIMSEVTFNFDVLAMIFCPRLKREVTAAAGEKPFFHLSGWAVLDVKASSSARCRTDACIPVWQTATARLLKLRGTVANIAGSRSVSNREWFFKVSYPPRSSGLVCFVFTY